jgi:hypothetical protein
VQAVVAAGELQGAVARAERASFAARNVSGPSRLGDDVDDAADRACAVESALGPAQDLDLLDLVRIEVGEVEEAIGGPS